MAGRNYLWDKYLTVVTAKEHSLTQEKTCLITEGKSTARVTLLLGHEKTSWRRPACLQEAYLYPILFKDATLKKAMELGNNGMHFIGDRV